MIILLAKASTNKNNVDFVFPFSGSSLKGGAVPQNRLNQFIRHCNCVMNTSLEPGNWGSGPSSTHILTLNKSFHLYKTQELGLRAPPLPKSMILWLPISSHYQLSLASRLPISLSNSNKTWSDNHRTPRSITSHSPMRIIYGIKNTLNILQMRAMQDTDYTLGDCLLFWYCKN